MAVESAVAALVANLSVDADFRGRLQVDGVLIEYRARLIQNELMSVGTIFPVK